MVSDMTGKWTTLIDVLYFADTQVCIMLARKYITLSILKKKIPVIPPLDYPYQRPVQKFCQQNYVIILAILALVEDLKDDGSFGRYH